MTVAQRLQSSGDALTPTERRIADVVLSTPQTVAFGTVADVAAASGAGTATVVRFATKLGYEGFVAFQRAVQAELSNQLLPAAARIRQLGEDDLIGRHATAEEGNVASTLAGIDVDALAATVAMLADDRRPVQVLSGSSSRGVSTQFLHDLVHLRPDVDMVEGNQVDVLQALALATSDTIVVAVDVRRYDTWLVEALVEARDRSLDVVAVTDSVLSPLAVGAAHAFIVDAASTGPFDSHVGTLALLNLFVVEVAVARRSKATKRLDLLEGAWSAREALAD